MLDITVFIISSGEPSFSRCLQLAQNQVGEILDITYKIKVISNITPMYKAFQRMLDTCDTKYLVQVDADMLLEPDAIARLRLGIENSSKRDAMFVGWLWDEDVERPIQGIKIYKSDIVKQFPYTNSLSCEMGQLQDMKRLGYSIKVDVTEEGGVPPKSGCFGEHFASQNPEMAFKRWERCMLKMRKLPWMAWLGIYPKKFMDEYAKNPNDEILKAKVFGIMSGLSKPIEDIEQDSSVENQSFRRFSALMGEYSHGPTEMVLYITDKCNFKCVFDGNPCLRESDSGYDGNGNITIEQLEDILKMYPTIKGCCVAGYGEPLLHKGLGDLLDLCSKYGVFVGIITNGSLVRNKISLLQHKAIAYVSVSLNATNAERHHAFSRTKTWNKVLEGLEKLSEAGIHSGFSYVVTKHNVKEIPEAMKIAKDLNVKFVHFHNILPHDGSKSLTFVDSVLTEDCYEELALIEEYKQIPMGNIEVAFPKILVGPVKGKCMSPIMSLGVDGGGFISSCRRIDAPEQKFGHYSQGWFSPHRLDLLFNVTGDRNTHDSCNACFGNWYG